MQTIYAYIHTNKYLIMSAPTLYVCMPTVVLDMTSGADTAALLALNSFSLVSRQVVILNKFLSVLAAAAKADGN